MRFLSLFSGIEAASYAWLPLGWECVGVAEIESFPCAVLKHHYPDVPNLGDVTKITEERIRALGLIDLVVGGFPCQDVSVAGRRKGMRERDGQPTRSGLFFDAMRIVRAAKPRWFLIENVPGLLSSNGGHDFGSVVAEILGIRFNVPKTRWANSGCACSERGLLEWATLDAQWFGVPQRRRRLFALADFGDWTSRPPVLLEPFSLQGHSPPSRSPWTATTALTANGVGAGGGADDNSAQGSQLVAATLQAHADKMWADSPMVVANSLNGNSGRNQIESTYVAHTLRADGFDASEDGTGRGTPLIPVLFQDSEFGAKEYDTAGTLRAGREPHHQILVQPVAFTTQQEPKWSEDGSAFTVTDASSIGEPSVVAFNDRGCDGGAQAEVDDESLANIRSASGGSSRTYVAFTCKDYGGDAGDISPTLRAMNENASNANAGGQIAVAFNPQAGGKQTTLGMSEVAGAMSTSTMLGAMINSAVRRLTPEECEKLQGFEPGYTDVPYRKKQAADGPRYRALGNSMAVPCMEYIGARIECVLKGSG